MTDEQQLLMSPGEVARLLRVDPKTVSRWASQGKLHSVRTPGGHRRFFAEEVHRMLKVESGS